MRTLRLPLLAVLLSAGAHPQPWLVRGTVSDAASGQPLPAATVQLAGTWRGTMANDEGEYRLEVRGLPAVLKVSYIGYASRDSVLAAAPGRVDFALTPVPFRFEPVVVTAEDPAEAIMREVIRRKQEWRPGLAGYRAEAYTRRVLENEKEIVLIGELASEIYWDRERGLREVVKSRRVTRNQGPDAAHVSALQGFVNFYDDDIPFIGHELIGPTHPDALEQYRFRLAGRRYLDDKVVFDISVEPRNRLQSALAGRVSVLDGEFALLEAELAPSRGSVSSAVPLPVIEQMDVAWRQQFRRFAAGVWLPVDYRASMKVKVGVVGLRFPAARFNQVTRLGEYEVNVDMPDSLYAGEEILRVDSLAVAQDSSFARLADKVPLSAREEAAYASIDSTLRFERAFRATGFLARFIVPEPGEERSEHEGERPRRPGTENREGGFRVPGLAGLEPELSYDRVAGAHLGLKGRRSLGGGMEASAGAGYDAGPRRVSFKGGMEWRRGAGRAAVEYGRGSVPRIPSDSYTPLLNSAQSLIGLDDYFDYYWREGLRWRAGLSLPRRIGLELGFKDEEHSSLEGTEAFNLLGRDWSRPNPAVEEGRMRSLGAGFTWGGPYRPFGLTPNRRIEARVEHGSGSLGGDFSFTRLRLVLDGHFRTFLKRRSTPNALDLRLVAGYSLGKLPPQRFGALEAGMAFFSPFGTFRTVRGHPFEGERYAALYWEHNFRSTPFELLGLWHWAMRGTGLVVHGASGRTWIDPERLAGLGYVPRYRDGFRHEAGVSLILYNLLRLDLTRRLDRPGWSAGASVARFDFGPARAGRR